MTEKEQYWIFTFTQSSLFKDNYIKFKGTYAEARQKMFNNFGEHWAFQYKNEEAAGVSRFNLTELVKTDGGTN